MHPDFQHLMQEATRLTRAGELARATAVIQAALGATPPAAPEMPPGPADMVIDIEARDIESPALPAPETDAGTPVGTGEFVAGHWGEGPAGRDYKLYIPPSAGIRPLPLVVMLHGCTQDPDDFATGTRMNEAARARDCFVLYPAQSARANPQRCWNWFKHNHQGAGRGEPALLAAMTRDVMARHAIDPARVYVAGLSAGGAMAAILGAAYPELFAAVGVHSGLAAGAARDLPSALAAMRSGSGGVGSTPTAQPTIVFHGDADATVHPVNGRHIVEARTGATPADEVARQRGAGGRSFTRSVHRNLDGAVVAEHWIIHGGPHAWSGGSPRGTYTDPDGPDATAEMLRFFLEHPKARQH